MHEPLSKFALLAVCAWMTVAAGLPAGVICGGNAQQTVRFELDCGPVCDRPATPDRSRKSGALAPTSSDCADTPIGLEATFCNGGRDDLSATLTQQPVAGILHPPADASHLRRTHPDHSPRPRAGPTAPHLRSVVLLI